MFLVSKKNGDVEMTVSKFKLKIRYELFMIVVSMLVDS